MTIVSRDAESRGGGRSRSLLLPPSVKRENEEVYSSPAGRAVDAGNQEKAENSERVVAVDGLDGLRRGPEVAVVVLELPPHKVQRAAKRGRDNAIVLEPSWLCKKRRSAAAAECKRPNAAIEENRAAAATPSPRTHKPANPKAGEDSDKRFRVVYTSRGRKIRSPGGIAGEPRDGRKEEKIMPCDIADGFQGQEVGEMARRAATTAISEGAATTAISEGASAAVDQENRAKPVRLRISQRMKRLSDGKNRVQPLPDTSDAAAVGTTDRGMEAFCEKELDLHVVHAVPSHMNQVAALSHELKNLHILEAEAANGNITDQSDRKIKKEPSESSMSTIIRSEDIHIIGLSSRLQSLGVTSVTPILSKNVFDSDCAFDQSRLLFSRFAFKDSPLLKMLTPEEHSLLHSKKEGLPIEVLDRYGCSYDLTLKYLPCNNAYRLIGQWRKFLTQNCMNTGDMVELGAFRFEGQLVLTLVHNGKDKTKDEKSTSSMTEECKEESASKETGESKEECSSRETEKNGEERDYMEAEGSREEQASRLTEATKELTFMEWQAALALVKMQKGNDPKAQ